MKKLYVSIFLLGLGSVVNAQKAVSPIVANDLTPLSPKAEVLPAPKATYPAFWSDDFSTPSNWTVDNSGQTGATFGWSIDGVKDGWWASSATVTSNFSGNFAELSNGNPTVTPATQALNVVYNLTTATPVDLTTQGTNISLSFKQYGARFNDLQEVQVSQDGVTFTTVANNLNYTVLSSSGGSAYPIETRLINLAPYIGGYTQVYIRFRWTTNYPSSASNPNVWVAYGWYIDDVALAPNADYDLAVNSTYWGSAGLNYYQIPSTQTAPIDFSANVLNGGTQTMTNTVLNVDVNTGAWTGTSSPRTINSMATDSLFTTTQFTPSAVGAYVVNRTLTSTDVDDVPNNNVMAPINFSVTNYIYARDNNTPAGSTSNTTNGFETGNLFDIWTNQTIRAIDVRLLGGASGSTAGTEIFVKIYSIDPSTGDFVWEGESDPFIISTANMNTNLIMRLNAPVNLLAGETYLAVVGAYGAGLRVSNAGTSPAQTSFLYDMSNSTWYYQTGTPMVRLNFDPSVGIEENEAAVSIGKVYPNPTSGTTAINYTIANSSAVAMEIVDITGKVIYTQTVGQQNAGDHTLNIDATNFANGIYYVNIATEEFKATKKFIKK